MTEQELAEISLGMREKQQVLQGLTTELPGEAEVNLDDEHLTPIAVSSTTGSSSDGPGLESHEAPSAQRENQPWGMAPETPDSPTPSQRAAGEQVVVSGKGGGRTLATPATPVPREDQGTTGRNVQDEGGSDECEGREDCPTQLYSGATRLSCVECPSTRGFLYYTISPTHRHPVDLRGTHQAVDRGLAEDNYQDNHLRSVFSEATRNMRNRGEEGRTPGVISVRSDVEGEEAYMCSPRAQSVISLEALLRLSPQGSASGEQEARVQSSVLRLQLNAGQEHLSHTQGSHHSGRA